ncbi:MAG: hypothetical protein JWM11_1800 [Planctomycetaceae bacterium]|nr:hypothetical protein [Planctomycetaceae bacterium]
MPDRRMHLPGKLDVPASELLPIWPEIEDLRSVTCPKAKVWQRWLLGVEPTLIRQSMSACGFDKRLASAPLNNQKIPGWTIYSHAVDVINPPRMTVATG